MIKQRTLRNVIRAKGVGLHSGKEVSVTLRPASINTGIIFNRVDLNPQVAIMARTENISDTRLASTLGKGTARRRIGW